MRAKFPAGAAAGFKCAGTWDQFRPELARPAGTSCLGWYGVA